MLPTLFADPWAMGVQEALQRASKANAEARGSNALTVTIQVDGTFRAYQLEHGLGDAPAAILYAGQAGETLVGDLVVNVVADRITADAFTITAGRAKLTTTARVSLVFYPLSL